MTMVMMNSTVKLILMETLEVVEVEDQATIDHQPVDQSLIHSELHREIPFKIILVQWNLIGNQRKLK